MDELFLELQTALAGEYSIERELGRGGMGIVYLAREVRLAREVAIKVLPPALASSTRLREQFLREAQTAARLSHPNIVPIHRVDEAGGFVYFVMAYVAGETLAERVRNRGPLAPHVAARMLREVAWALTYAHSTGIIHRDIKPENILLEHGTDRAIVTDFGIAGAAHADARTNDGQIAGSAHYASPEQIAGQPLDAPSDLYSLGATAFFALCGRVPFDAPTSREVLAMHLNSRPPALASFAPATPAKLAHIVERCLAKRPEHRFATAAAFAEAIDQAIEPPRELPTALRVWLNQTNQHERPAVQLIGAAALTFGVAIPLAVGTGIPALGVLIGATAFISVGILPSIVRMSRVLGAGYGIDDLRAAMRTYWAQRREEVLFEVASPSHRLPGRMVNWIFAGSAALGLSFSSLAAAIPGPAIRIAATMAWTFTFGSGILALRDWTRLRTVNQLGRGQMRFYDSKWGERFVRLCGWGVKKRPAATALPQLTEVALGRATDALYDALPRGLRKQLKALPPAVKRLESDAKTLRAEIDRMDTSIAQLDGDARAAMPSAIANSDHETRIRAERDQLRADLRALRERASERLAATVAALENIRLDLLRLQLGDGNVSSVTASLDAARQIETDLDGYLTAARDLERELETHATPANGLE